MSFVLPTPLVPSIPVENDDRRFPVHRIYCIGRNYAEHAKEMGISVDRALPTFFMKPGDAVVTDDADVAYPGATTNLHHEVEMVVALGSGGRDIPVDDALGHVFGYAVGLDLTRRDLQSIARANGMPWDTAKGFDGSAPISAIRRADAGDALLRPENERLRLEVNGEVRQDASIADMVHGVAEIIATLSTLYTLTAGDLIFTGTPAGVGPLERGDRFVASLEGIAELRGRVV